MTAFASCRGFMRNGREPLHPRATAFLRCYLKNAIPTERLRERDPRL